MLQHVQLSYDFRRRYADPCAYVDRRSCLSGKLHSQQHAVTMRISISDSLPRLLRLPGQRRSRLGTVRGAPSRKLQNRCAIRTTPGSSRRTKAILSQTTSFEENLHIILSQHSAREAIHLTFSPTVCAAKFIHFGRAPGDSSVFHTLFMSMVAMYRHMLKQSDIQTKPRMET